MIAAEEKQSVLKFGYAKPDCLHLLLTCDDAICLNHYCNFNILDSGFGYDTGVSDILQHKEAVHDNRIFYDSDELAFRYKSGEETCGGRGRCVSIRHLLNSGIFGN